VLRGPRRAEAERLQAEGYRGRIMEKLNLHSSGELLRFAMPSGLTG
jgi:DNA-binding CsgD family transcriptional regulator